MWLVCGDFCYALLLLNGDVYRVVFVLRVYSIYNNDDNNNNDDNAGYSRQTTDVSWLLPLASCLWPLVSYLSTLVSYLFPLDSCLLTPESRRSNQNVRDAKSENITISCNKTQQSSILRPPSIHPPVLYNQYIQLLSYYFVLGMICKYSHTDI